VDYTISYDPTSGTTTLINELDSAEDLPFWTQFGPDSGELLGVSPGSTATVDAAGDVSGPITKGGRCPNNKKADRSKDVTVNLKQMSHPLRTAFSSGHTCLRTPQPAVCATQSSANLPRLEGKRMSGGTPPDFVFRRKCEIAHRHVGRVFATGSSAALPA
jgi:hypothetical protein